MSQPTKHQVKLSMLETVTIQAEGKVVRLELLTAALPMASKALPVETARAIATSLLQAIDQVRA